MLEALLWDVDGTLAETEREGHLAAFNSAFASVGVPWRWSESRYAELLKVAGGRERLRHDFDSQRDAPAEAADREALIERVHRLKNEMYASVVATGALPLRAGVRELLEDCRRERVRLAIVTTTSRANAEALLEAHLGPAWSGWFESVVCAEEAPRKKPDPQAYEFALKGLGLEAGRTLAIEDSPIGARAARNAGVPVVRVESFFFAGCERDGEIAVGPSLGERRGWDPLPEAPLAARIDLGQLRRWHAAAAQAGAARNSAV